jgi:hypothetical protein
MRSEEDRAAAGHSGTAGQGETAGQGDTAPVKRTDLVQRVLLLLAGLGLLICGVVAAFRSVDGIGVAALLAAGFALAFVGYLGEYITSIRFRDFEARLERSVQQVERSVQQVEVSAAQAVNLLDTAANRYAEIRSGMERGPERVDELSKELERQTEAARRNPPPKEEVVEKAKSKNSDSELAALGAMRADPGLWDFDAMLYAIEHTKRGFEQDRYLELAADMLHRTTPDERMQLFDAVEYALTSGKISRDWVRWLSAVRLLRLIKPAWRPPNGSLLNQG